MKQRRRVLVLDDDAQTRQQLGVLLEAAGFDVHAVATLQEAEAAIAEARPALVLLEPRTESRRGLGMLRSLKAHAETADVPVLVVTSLEGAEVLTEAFDAGADDFVRKPIRDAELMARIRNHLRMAEEVGELARKEQDAHAMVELTQALASSLDFHEILYTVVRRIAEVVKVDRVSIVLAPEQEHGDVGYVAVASDDAQLSNLRIDLAKYPEIQQVLRTRESLLIDDVATHPVLDGVREDLPQGQRGPMVLLPIVWRDVALGVLFLRAAVARARFSERETDFCRSVANATAIALRNARVMQSLRDHTQQETFARFEAERRLASLRRYADLFASSADGIGVFDTTGLLLFANPRAYAMLGRPEGTLDQRKVRDVVHAQDQALARDIWEGFSRGDFPRDIDIRLAKADGGVLIANVSFSSLLHGEGAVLFSFRDVTEARRIEGELVRTKEFLESLIQASVDGIVAADMTGLIILFNRGAEQIYDYTANDVVGKMNVRDLYPDGVAREVMAMLVSAQHGGPGKLESTRLEVVGADGSLVPISLSAAMIYQGGEAVATFGIFTDLRERLRVEERLAHAQQKLAVTEKQALIAELAGTAAHELNQPLTSIMGYAELLKRKLPRESSERNAADIIVREAERMAEIVRKIGQITKYETKAYVGEQKILDLDKASGAEEPATEAGEP